MSWPAVVFWLLLVVGFVSDGPLLVYVFAVGGAFGTLQMLPGEAVSVNVLPQSACAAVIIAKVLLRRGNVMRAVETSLDPARLGLFALFSLFALLTAFAMPRIFAGRVEVVAVAVTMQDSNILYPASGNVTQSAYAILSFFTAAAFAILGEGESFRRIYLKAVLLSGVTFIGTGLLDLLCYLAGAGELLAPFRTASYHLLVDTEAVSGAKRITGLMSEASVFGTACLTTGGLLILLRPCYDAALRRLVVPTVALVLLVMAALSTSATALAGLGVFGSVVLANWVARWHGRQALHRDAIAWEIAIAALSGIIVFALVVAAPSVLTPVYDLFNDMLFQKGTSSSYIERTSWTRTAWEALMTSGGIGVGFGSVRTSNWFVSILSSTGFAGGAVLFAFLLRLLFSRLPPLSPWNRELARALRFGLVPPLLMNALSWTTPDMGVGLAAVLGLLTAVVSRPKDVQIDVDPVRQTARSAPAATILSA